MKQFPDKLDPLIRRLSTDSDGEAVACVRAIQRVLSSAGMTFHDVADRLKAPHPSAGYETSASRAYREFYERQEREAAARAAAGAPGDFKTWIEAVEWVFTTHGQSLRQREQEFVQSLRESLPVWHRPTEKQEKWLRDILARFGVK